MQRGVIHRRKATRQPPEEVEPLRPRRRGRLASRSRSSARTLISAPARWDSPTPRLLVADHPVPGRQLQQLESPKASVVVGTIRRRTGRSPAAGRSRTPCTRSERRSSVRQSRHRPCPMPPRIAAGGGRNTALTARARAPAGAAHGRDLPLQHRSRRTACATRTPPGGAACTHRSQSTHSSRFSSTMAARAVRRLREDVHGTDLGQLLRELACHACASGVMSTRMNMARHRVDRSMLSRKRGERDSHVVRVLGRCSRWLARGRTNGFACGSQSSSALRGPSP